MKVSVLGAGVIGVTTAWYLRKSGYDVTVIERRSGPGLETSFANGGQISASHAEPWANPTALTQIIKWLGREDAPLLFRPRADWMQWRWAARFLLECVPPRPRHNMIASLRLALYSRSLLKALRAETGIAYDHSERGILHFYTDRTQLKTGLHAAQIMTEFGCERTPKTPAEIVALEPALRPVASQLVGGDYARSDESGDACAFTQNLAALCAAAGVKFMYDTQVERLERSGEKISAVQIRSAAGEPSSVVADAYVVALGSYSPFLVKPLGIRLLVYPVKGYSVTIAVTDPIAAPQVSLCDDEYKLVFSRLGDRLRVAGTAEFTGYDVAVNPTRCDAILRRTAALFPGAGDYARAIRWAGLRPATPSNLPYVGRARYPNLFLNTGHGTLGWTMACGSGHLIAEMVSGRKPEIDASAYAVMGRGVQALRVPSVALR